jgi:hypothetical protein
MLYWHADTLYWHADYADAQIRKGSDLIYNIERINLYATTLLTKPPCY